MTDKTHSDVDRALAAFGSPAIKYRSFGAPVMRPTNAAAAASPAARPVLPVDADPFDVPAPPQRATPNEMTAATLFPLLAAAIAETSSVPLHGAMNGPPLAAGALPTESRAERAGYSLPSGGFSPAPQPAATRYAVPDDFDAMPPAAMASRAGGQAASSPYYIPEALSPAPGTQAPGTQAPGTQANFAQMAHDQMAHDQMAHESAVVRAYAPPVAADARPFAAPVQTSSQTLGPAASYAAPPPIVAAPHSPPAESRGEDAALPAFVTLAAHFPPPGVGPAGALADGADRRSLAEMFRVLSDRSGAPHLPQGGLAGGAIEEPGLFRRI